MGGELQVSTDSIVVLRKNNERQSKSKSYETHIEFLTTLEDLEIDEPGKLNKADSRAIQGFAYSLASLLGFAIPIFALFSAPLAILVFIYSIQGLKTKVKWKKKLSLAGIILSSGFFLFALLAFIFIIIYFSA